MATAVRAGTDGDGVISDRPKQSLFRSRVLILLYQVIIFVAFVGFWQLASGNLISAFWVSSPSAIWQYLVKNIGNGVLPGHAYWTLYETVVGFVLGSIFGIAFGFILSRLDTVARTLDPFIMGFYGIPRIALAPLFIVWFGIGELSKIVLVLFTVFFLCFINTYAGVKGVNRDLKNIVRVMGGSELQILTKITIPAAAPWIITGLKISVPYAFVGAIVGEFMVSSKGLGYLLQLEANMFNTTGVLAGVVVLAVVVVIVNDLLNRLENHAMRWRPKDRPEGEREGW